MWTAPKKSVALKPGSGHRRVVVAETTWEVKLDLTERTGWSLTCTGPNSHYSIKPDVFFYVLPQVSEEMLAIRLNLPAEGSVVSAHTFAILNRADWGKLNSLFLL